MNVIKLLATALLGCLPALTQAQGGVYAGIDVGAARSDVTIEEYVFFGATTDRASGSTTGFRLRGGYQFGRFFALEAGYVDFGQFENHFDPDDCPNGAPGPCPLEARTSVSGIFGGAVGILPLGERWLLTARLGYVRMKIDTQEIGATGLDGSTDSDGLHYGIAAGYRFNDHWTALLDYSGYDQADFGLTLDGSFGAYDLGETTMTSLGVNYRW